MKRSIAALAVAALVALTGCTSTGTGYGGNRNGTRVSFTWQENSASTGVMTAQVNNGESYSGRYFQITRETRVDDLGPLWMGWHGRHGSWRYWGPDPWDRIGVRNS